MFERLRESRNPFIYEPAAKDSLARFKTILKSYRDSEAVAAKVLADEAALEEHWDNLPDNPFRRR